MSPPLDPVPSPSRPAPASMESGADPGAGAVKRHARLLNRARKDPDWILGDRRCLKPQFCEGFFEVCDDVALQEPPKALRYAEVAADLARKIGDRHLIHRAHGVLAHACIARRDRDRAEQVLEDCRLSALSCCKACSSDWLMRRGDLLAESQKGTQARAMIARSREELGDRLDADTDARLSFIEGIGCLFELDRDGALEQVGKALRGLDLTSPRGYFLDSIAFIGWYLDRGAEPRHFEEAARHLDDLQERLKGLDDWGDVRVRKCWVEGLVHGRLGDWRKAVDKLDSARQALLRSGPPRHAVAVTLDECQAHARRMNDVSLRLIERMLGICRRKRDLDPTMRNHLKHLLKAVSWQPETAPYRLASFRKSFIVPVPGLLGELVIPPPLPPVGEQLGDESPS
jgi:hypothetical protein